MGNRCTPPNLQRRMGASLAAPVGRRDRRRGLGADPDPDPARFGGRGLPLWPGHPMTAHWGIMDRAEAAVFRRRAAFAHALEYPRHRMAAFVNLPIGSHDPRA